MGLGGIITHVVLVYHHVGEDDCTRGRVHAAPSRYITAIHGQYELGSKHARSPIDRNAHAHARRVCFATGWELFSDPKSHFPKSSIAGPPCLGRPRVGPVGHSGTAGHQGSTCLCASPNRLADPFDGSAKPPKLKPQYEASWPQACVATTSFVPGLRLKSLATARAVHGGSVAVGTSLVRLTEGLKRRVELLARLAERAREVEQDLRRAKGKGQGAIP